MTALSTNADSDGWDRDGIARHAPARGTMWTSSADRSPVPDSPDVVVRLAELVAAARRAVVFTGAGVSTGSGLPDFRSPTGLWTRYDPREMTFQRHVADPAVRRAGWEMRREFLNAGALPNAAHHAIAALEDAGHVAGVVTQNIDGLHQAAGSTRVVELHGTATRTTCIGQRPVGGEPAGCGWSAPTREVLARIDAGEEDPRCPDCGGIPKPATISFGQAMDVATVEAAWALVDRADLVLAVGTSLEVYPAASLVPTAHEMGVALAICNAEPTPFDHLATVVSRDLVETVLPAVVERVHGTDDRPDRDG